MHGRTHEQIIKDASEGRTDAELTAALGFAPERIQRVRDWRRRKRIPPEWWNAVVGAGLSSLEELADAAARAGDAADGPEHAAGAAA